MEKDPGQITAAVGRVCLRFKNKVKARNGQVFVKCVFAGEGSSLFVARPAPRGSGQRTPGADSTAVLPPLIAQSEPVVITALSQALEEEGAAAAVVSRAVDDGDPAGDTPATTPTVGTATVVSAADAAATVMDIGFSLDSTKFVLTEQNLSLLENTAIKMELCMRSGSGGSEDIADAAVVVGTVGVKIASVLRGENQWTADLALGAYTPTPSQADPTLAPVDEALQEAGTGELACTAESVVEKEGIDAEDTSPGPLEYGGSTSTMRVTLATNDDTADYTLGAGSLWTDGAEVDGLPEGWKVRPPPETERSSWNNAITQILAGTYHIYEYMYEYENCMHSYASYLSGNGCYTSMNIPCEATMQRCDDAECCMGV